MQIYGNNPVKSKSEGFTFLDKKEQSRKRPSKEAFRRRAFKKYLSIQLTKRLISLNSPLKPSYNRIFSCATVIVQKDGKMTSKYCGDRWCKLCQSIRTAKAISGYHPQLEKMEDIHFVTFTRVNVREGDLRDEINAMLAEFKKILDVVRKRGIKVKGLRKLECTYNKKDDSYNPHFHMIIEGKENAQMMLEEWMARNPEAYSGAQSVEKADNGSIMELLKYSLKLPAKIEDESDDFIYALDAQFRAMRHKRTLQPFGGLRRVSEEVDDLDAVIAADDDTETAYVWHDHDWYNVETGEPLSGYEPDKLDDDSIKDPPTEGGLSPDILNGWTYIEN